MQLLDELLNGLSVEHRTEFLAAYERIQSLPTSEVTLQNFMDDYLRSVVSLYAATAGAIWFRSPDSTSLRINARLGYSRLGIEDEIESAHDDLVQYAFTNSAPFLVRPFSSPQTGAGVSNPTDSFVVYGPVIAGNETIALVELFLGPTPIRGKTSGDRQRYVLWLDHLLGFFCQGIEQKLLGTSAPLQPAMARIDVIKNEIVQLQQSIRDTIQHALQRFAGWNFGSLKENQAFTKTVHRLLDENGLRVECPECGCPAILRCQAAGNARTGVFVFDHYLPSGRTFHGGRANFPRIKLTPKPPRKTSKKAAE